MTYEKPLLVIPPYINKYYVMDLNEQNQWLDDWLKKATVFMISWVNPDEKYAHYSLTNTLQKEH